MNKTYPEDEVFDTMLDAEGDNKDPDTESMEGINPPSDPSTPITPEMEKCIVFTSKILELLHKHGETICKTRLTIFY